MIDPGVQVSVTNWGKLRKACLFRILWTSPYLWMSGFSFPPGGGHFPLEGSITCFREEEKRRGHNYFPLYATLQTPFI